MHVSAPSWQVRAAVKEAESALLQLWQEKVARLRRRARADRLRVEQLEAEMAKGGGVYTHPHIRPVPPHRCTHARLP